MVKVKKTRPRTATSAAYKNFLENLQLYGLGLEKLNAKLERTQYYAAMTEQAEEVEREIRTKFVISEFDSNHFDVEGSFELSLRVGEKEPILLIEATYSAHFHPREGSFDRKNADNFADSEARLVFWPYFRQAIADATARMHVPPITIPLVFRP